jgi:hypothetical protein
MYSKVKMYCDELLKGRNSDLWKGYVNMLKTIKSLFLSPNHWVFEFIQNAEDADSTKVFLKLEENFLEIMNNGKPFDEKDFRAICNVNSPKIPSSGQLGYLGIGFKSIFKVSECVEIHSGDYHFKFDKNGWTKEDALKFPWEILPVETQPLIPPSPYFTKFRVFLKSEEIKEKIKEYLDNFPSETILFLKNISEIKIELQGKGFKIISKKIKDKKMMEYGKQEKILVEENNNKLGYYLVFRKIVKVPQNVKEDEETMRVKRSGVEEREIGIVFNLDENENLKLSESFGRISGVYSFLPVESEQTELPFGIYGDFIPNPGRDLINYEALWNKWIRGEIIQFFKDIVEKIIAPHDEWCFYIEKLKGNRPRNSFWDEMHREIINFLENGPFYPDIDGIRRKKDELIWVDPEILNLVGRKTIENIYNKKIAHPKFEKTFFLRSFIDTIYDIILEAPASLEELKNNSESLCKIYREISKLSDYYIKGRNRKNTPFSDIPFVLAENGEFYKPLEVMKLEIDFEELPKFIKTLYIQKNKRILHPLIAKDAEAVSQLERCGLKHVNRETILEDLKNLIENIKSKNDLPPSWSNNDPVEAILFLIKECKGDLKLDYIPDESGNLKPTSTLIWPENWSKVLNFLPGFYKIHEGFSDPTIYTKYGITIDEVKEFLKKSNVHGFDKEKDKILVEKSAMEIAKEILRKKGHNPQDVSDRDRLGYDLECHHCGRVFEIKGMTEPKDIELTESEVWRCKNNEDKFILIIVYNLPSNFCYKEINGKDLMSKWEPVEKAKIPMEKWLSVNSTENGI